MKYCITRLLLMVSMLCLLTPLEAMPTGDLKTQPVVICLDSETQWPPYYYHPVDEHEGKTTHREGASIDLIHRVFDELAMPFVIKQMPWPRVLEALKKPSKDEFCEVSWDMSLNEERLDWLLFTEPIYQISTGGFYNKNKLTGLDSFFGVAQLFSYEICGIRGYDYTPIDSLISIRVAREQQALDLVALGRCDVFVSTVETIVYGAKMGIYKLNENTDYLVGRGFERIMYAVVSTASPRAKQLHKQLNKALKQLKLSGETEVIFKKYIEKGTGF